MTPLSQLIQEAEEPRAEHLSRGGTRYTTEKSEYDGFCPRCLYTEEEASEGVECKTPQWLVEELTSYIKKGYESGREEQIKNHVCENEGTPW